MKAKDYLYCSKCKSAENMGNTTPEMLTAVENVNRMAVEIRELRAENASLREELRLSEQGWAKDFNELLESKHALEAESRRRALEYLTIDSESLANHVALKRGKELVREFLDGLIHYDGTVGSGALETWLDEVPYFDEFAPKKEEQ